MTPRCRARGRRGIVLVEAGIVYSLAITLIVTTMAVALGGLRYQQLTWLTREGARWASLHGPDYQAAHNLSTQMTAQNVVDDAIGRGMSPFTADELTATLVYDMASTPKNVTYTLQYTWTPVIIPGSIIFTSKSTQTITY